MPFMILRVKFFEIRNWNLSICRNHKQKIDFEELFSKSHLLGYKELSLGKSKKAFHMKPKLLTAVIYLSMRGLRSD